MQTIEIYGKKVPDGAGGMKDCPWCRRAQALLTKRGYPFAYHDITDDPRLQDEFRTRTNGATTVPQIFVGITRLGGFNDMQALDLTGRLQQLIAGE